MSVFRSKEKPPGSECWLRDNRLSRLALASHPEPEGPVRRFFHEIRLRPNRRRGSVSNGRPRNRTLQAVKRGIYSPMRVTKTRVAPVLSSYAIPPRKASGKRGKENGRGCTLSRSSEKPDTRANDERKSTRTQKIPPRSRKNKGATGCPAAPTWISVQDPTPPVPVAGEPPGVPRGRGRAHRWDLLNSRRTCRPLGRLTPEELLGGES